MHLVQAFKWAAPSILTIGALLCGLTAVRFSAEGDFGDCIKCIFLACVLDGLDGHVARALGTSSAMGFELDSLCDLANFGVSPPCTCSVRSLGLKFVVALPGVPRASASLLAAEAPRRIRRPRLVARGFSARRVDDRVGSMLCSRRVLRAATGRFRQCLSLLLCDVLELTHELLGTRRGSTCPGVPSKWTSSTSRAPRTNRSHQ